MEEFKCDYDSIFSTKYTWEEKCHTLTAPCAEMQDFYNFFSLFICTFHGSYWMVFPFCIFCTYLIFNNIMALVDEYI